MLGMMEFQQEDMKGMNYMRGRRLGRHDEITKFSKFTEWRQGRGNFDGITELFQIYGMGKA